MAGPCVHCSSQFTPSPTAISPPPTALLSPPTLKLGNRGQRERTACLGSGRVDTGLT